VAAGVRVLDAPPPQDDQLWHLKLRPDLPREAIVVGTGPAGQMAAYLLAVHGVRVQLLDRGRDVTRATSRACTSGASRSDSTTSTARVAPAPSDSKLWQPRTGACASCWKPVARPAILWRHHPHIGSSILPHMCACAA
jgi:choline dehydrogenase-like flavoprotein